MKSISNKQTRIEIKRVDIESVNYFPYLGNVVAYQNQPDDMSSLEEPSSLADQVFLTTQNIVRIRNPSSIGTQL